MKNSDIYDEISKNLILNDCQTIKKIIECLKGKEYEDIFYMGVMPYFAMWTEGMLSFYEGKADYDRINFEYGELIKNIRSKMKMYNDKLGKNINKTEIIQKGSNNYFADLCKFELVRYLGLYDDFGVYISSNKYIGNTFLYSWYFENSLDIKDEDLRKQTLVNIGKAVGETINVTLNELLKLNQTPVLNYHRIDVFSKDYLLSKNKTVIFNDKYDKYTTIILFNILCSINFVLYILGKILLKDNKLEQTKNSLGEKNKLRNCLSHYRVTEEYIEEENISMNVPFYGLIEKYTGKDYYAFNKELEDNLINISSLLKKWVLD